MTVKRRRVPADKRQLNRCRLSPLSAGLQPQRRDELAGGAFISGSKLPPELYESQMKDVKRRAAASGAAPTARAGGGKYFVGSQGIKDALHFTVGVIQDHCYRRYSLRQQCQRWYFPNN